MENAVNNHEVKDTAFSDKPVNKPPKTLLILSSLSILVLISLISNVYLYRQNRQYTNQINLLTAKSAAETINTISQQNESIIQSDQVIITPSDGQLDSVTKNTPLPSIAPLSQWKEYTNSTLGISFKYPPTATVDTKNLATGETLRIGQSRPNPYGGGGLEFYGWSLTFLNSKAKQPFSSIETWVKNNYSSDTNVLKYVRHATPAEIYEMVISPQDPDYNPQFHRFFIIGMEQVFILDANNTDPDGQATFVPMVHQFISNFKFNNSRTVITPLSGWKTYVSQKYNYTFQYPSEAVVDTTELNGGETLKVKNLRPDPQGGLEKLGWRLTFGERKLKLPFTSIESWVKTNMSPDLRIAKYVRLNTPAEIYELVKSPEDPNYNPKNLTFVFVGNVYIYPMIASTTDSIEDFRKDVINPFLSHFLFSN